ncbi:MAG: phospholipase [Pirellulaceae bacterium]|nr:phospholipase [Pirellulaceae bacterium]
MATLTESLRTLHRIHKQLSDLRSRLERGPKQMRLADGNVKKCEGELAAAKDVYKQAKMGSDEKQLQLKQREAKLKDLEAKLFAAQSNKEYQLLKDQIAADKQANSVLADEILEALDKLEHLQAAIKVAESNLAKTKDEAGKAHKKVEEQQQGLEAELARVSAELQAAEGLLDGEFKDTYLRLARSMQDEALAPIEGECCGGCGHTITAQTLNLLKLDKPTFCKSCGRLQYLPE